MSLKDSKMSKLKYSVYRNLHNGKLSITDSSGLVVGHAETVEMANVDFKVSQSGINKIRNEKKKYVVAKVKGDLVDVQGFTPYKGRRIMYDDLFGYDEHVLSDTPIGFNPYRDNGFTNQLNGDILSHVDYIVIRNSGQMYAKL